MRRTAAVTSARAASALSRGLKLGGGTALPGLLAQRLDPDLVPALSRQLGHGSVIVTGTNGKTTTSRVLRSIVRAAGLKPVGNREGSNMMRGVAAALAAAADWRGELVDSGDLIGVFEVDEATVPAVARAVRPRAVLFANLFRDQLDRYGEVETVATLWRRAVSSFPPDVTVVLNGDDPSVASIAPHARGPVVVFGLQDASLAAGVQDHAADARWCTACGAELEYDAVFYAHLGHWRCPACGNARPAPDIVCSEATPAGDGWILRLRVPGHVIEVNLRMPGVYNAYNALAAAAAAVALNLPPDAITRGISSVTAAFGRQERLQIGGREVQLALAKNPAGLNQLLRVITADGGQKDIAFFLNDNIADGRDISWIWDVDFEMLAGRVRSLTVSGTRAWDMALRLKYAGLGDRPHVEPDYARALKRALRETTPGGILHVVPTYTAMLEVRNILGRWAGRGEFWRGDDR
jgi:UDP-N-acetylmuramyl tripeptide synthase